MKQANCLIENAVWSIEPVKRREMASKLHDGQCDFDQQQIKVYRDLPFVDQVETVIHEVMHAQQPDIREEDITRRAKEITRVLFKTGILKNYLRS